MLPRKMFSIYRPYLPNPCYVVCRTLQCCLKMVPWVEIKYILHWNKESQTEIFILALISTNLPEMTTWWKWQVGGASCLSFTWRRTFAESRQVTSTKKEPMLKRYKAVFSGCFILNFINFIKEGLRKEARKHTSMGGNIIYIHTKRGKINWWRFA